jgi:hypothetical protein
MARFIGTGKDPRYPKGQVVDIATADESYSPTKGHAAQLDVVEKGWVRELKGPEEDPSYNAPQGVSQALIRGDNVTDPVERQIAKDEGLVQVGTGTLLPSETAYEHVHEDEQPDLTANGANADFVDDDAPKRVTASSAKASADAEKK